MDKNQRDRLIDKYLCGETTAEEEKILMQWYREQLQSDVEWKLSAEESAEEIKIRIAQNIKADFRKGLVRRISWMWPAAAITACLIGLVILFGINQMRRKPPVVVGGPSLVESKLQNPEMAENRFLVLSDSSKVLLRPGSTVEYANDFTGETREIRLVGEGYFDIRHMDDRPFIVHTGDIRTVVLGTAFTIKSSPGQEIQVTVQRGKVRIETHEKVLGELVANQQLEIDPENDRAEQKAVVAAEVLSWTAEGMSFDNETFGNLMQRMEKRYGTIIRFENESLQNCVVSGRFGGDETLDEVLMLLCATRNATFERTANNTIVIRGEGCISLIKKENNI